MFRFSIFIMAASCILLCLHDTAQAQAMSYSVARPSRLDPAVNVYLSARYDFLLQTSPRFRSYRMWKECHTINLVPLHGDCIVSFDQYEPIIPAYFYR
jgi:hypothetical protein